MFFTKNMKLLGKKLKMGQLWINDKVVPVTPIQIEKKADLSSVQEGDLVKAAGLTKGRGFQGVVKRHSFAGGPKTHGQKHSLRAPGSIGNTSPQRVVPGKKMGGHMGVERVTIKNLKVIKIDSENKILFLKGATPGNVGGRVELVKA